MEECLLLYWYCPGGTNCLLLAKRQLALDAICWRRACSAVVVILLVQLVRLFKSVPVPRLMPESPRWLVSQNRIDEARKELQRAAKMNKMSNLDDSVWQKELAPPKKAEKATVIDLLRHGRLARNTLILFYSWFAASMCYYGLAQNTSALPGAPFISYTAVALAEVPGGFYVSIALSY